VLNVKRSEALGDSVVVKCFFPFPPIIISVSTATTHLLEVRIVDLDLTGAKISDIKAAFSVQFSNGSALVDGSILRRRVCGVIDLQSGGTTGPAAGPGRDRAIFGHKDEQGRSASDFKVGTAIEDDPRRSGHETVRGGVGCSTGNGAIRPRNFYE